MSAASFPQTRSGRTFLVAAAVLGVAALAQVVALGWYLAAGGGRPASGLGTNRSVTTEDAAEPTPRSAPSKPAATVPAPPGVAAVTELPAPAPSAGAPAASPVAAFQPVPAPPAPAAPARAAMNPADLIAQARTLRSRGDTKSALARLREAQLIAPNNPELYAETALTYELMNLTDRATEWWQRVYDLGEAAGGISWQLADTKLRTGSVAPSPALRAGAADAAPSAPAEGDGRDLKLGIVSVDLREDAEDPTALQRLALRITVQNKPGRYVEPGKVAIQAYFYDMVEGQPDPVLTDAETSAVWITTPAEWDETKPQVLETVYFRPKPNATLPPPVRGKGAKAPRRPAPTPVPAAPATTRAYAGYIVRVYYNRELQEARADPPALLKQFPPEPVLGSE